VSAPDQFLYEASSLPDVESEPFLEKRVVYTPDEQNGTYSGVFSFTPESTANSGRWVDWKNAYVVTPFVVALDTSVGATGAANPLVVGLKNGFHQTTHSTSVSWNGQTLVQNTAFLNARVSFELTTQVSRDDLYKNGATWGLYPDTANSFRYSQTGARTGGQGVTTTGQLSPTTKIGV
jgi:hypothetical protein